MKRYILNMPKKNVDMWLRLQILSKFFLFENLSERQIKDIHTAAEV